MLSTLTVVAIGAGLCGLAARLVRKVWIEMGQQRQRIFVRQRVAVVTGCGSYLIKPRFFDQSVWDYSAVPRAAFYMDDIWISGCLDRRGVPKFVVPCSRRLLSVKEQAGTMTLHEVPNGRQPTTTK